MKTSLKQFDLFKEISSADILSMEQIIQVRRIKKNTILRFTPGVNLSAYFLLEGLMKAIATNDKGQEMIKFFIKPGMFIGEMSLLGRYEKETTYANAIENSVVALLDTEKLRQWLLIYKGFRNKVRQQIANRIQNLEDRLMAVVYEPAEKRIIDFIVSFSKEFGEMTESGWKVKNFLKNSDIAQVTATSRQTVSQVLNDLRNRLLIDYNQNFIKIPHTSELLKLKCNGHT